MFKINNLRFIAVGLLVAAASAVGTTSVLAATPETVKFPSRDGKTEFVGYLFKPAGAGPFAAVVMLHGRAGSYSSNKPGVIAADNLTARHRLWGEFWAQQGYLALHVDSFGPRGFAKAYEAINKACPPK